MAQILHQLNREALYFISADERWEINKERKDLKKARSRRAEEKRERKQKMADRRIQMIATGRMKDKKAKIRRKRD